MDRKQGSGLPLLHRMDEHRLRRDHVPMKTRNYIRINREYLLAEERPIDFNIYTLRAQDRAPILLFGRESNQDIHEILRRRRLGELYVEKSDYQRFRRYLEDSIPSLIQDDRVPLPKKAEIIYACAKEVMQDVFENPRSGENISRAKGMAEQIIALALNNYEAIPSMLKPGSRDYYTFSHCVNVAVFAIGLWVMINKGDDDDLYGCAVGSILHDVGKSEIDVRILNKPGRLTDTEFEIIKTHPEKGYNLMQGYVPEDALEIILHHHEKADGRGYPHGLTADQIPDCVKIATIADVYDALTTERPYASARSPFKALSLMKDEMVGHFEQKKFIDFINFLGGHFNSLPRC